MKLQELVNQYGLVKVRRSEWSKNHFINLFNMDQDSITFAEPGESDLQTLPIPTDEGWELYIPTVLNV